MRKFRLDAAGRLWAGTTGDGAYCFVDGQVFHVGVADGLAYPAVNDIYQSADGLLWFSTWGGE